MWLQTKRYATELDSKGLSGDILKKLIWEKSSELVSVRADVDLLRGRLQVRENNLKTVASLLDSEKENNCILNLQLDKLQVENNSLAVQLKLSQSQNR